MFLNGLPSGTPEMKSKSRVPFVAVSRHFFAPSVKKRLRTRENGKYWAVHLVVTEESYADGGEPASWIKDSEKEKDIDVTLLL